MGEKVQISGRVCLNCGAVYEDASTRFCIACLRSGTIAPQFHRPADAILPTTPSISAKELLRAQHRTFRCKAYPEIVLSEDAFVLVYGLPGNGKTLFSLLFAAGMTPCAYLPLEEKIGPSLASKLGYLEIHSETLTFHEPQSVNEIVELGASNGMRCLAIDSVNVSTLQPNDCLKLARGNKIVVLGVSQVTKAGGPRGSNDWVHLADVVIQVSALKWTVTKSRFQQANVGGAVT